MEYDDVLPLSEAPEVVRRRLGAEAAAGSRVLSVSASPLSDHVLGFLGEHLKVVVTVELKGGAVRELRFFAKIAPRKTSFHAAFVASMSAFEKEVLFYDEAAPLLRTPSEWAPECFLARGNLVLLEDLSLQGFRGLDSRIPLDERHMTAAMEALARMHAASLLAEAAEDGGGRGALGARFPDLCVENLFVHDEKNWGSGWFRAGIKGMQALAGELPWLASDPGKLARVRAALPGLCWGITRFVEPTTERRCVFVEGDLWSNNLLFRERHKDAQEGEDPPLDARIVDFQLVRYAPPALDIAFLVQTSTTRAFRRRHGTSLLRRYHAALEASLAAAGAAGGTAAEGLDFDALKRTVDDYSEFGRIVAACHHQLGMMSPDRLRPHVTTEKAFTLFMMQDRDDAVLASFREDPVYRKWLTEDMEELIECHILHTKTD